MTIDERTKDKIKGAFFGAAIGDALGAAVEFKTKAEVKALYPGGLHRFDQIDPKNFSRSWQVGEWTDDMEQSLCVAQTLMACGKIEPVWLANRLIYWLETDGRGLGRHTHLVLTHPQFLSDPEAAAFAVWESEKEGANAANGALMRTFPTGLWDYRDANVVIDNTAKACMTTHVDSRCVNSCLLFTFFLSRILAEPEKVEDLKPENNTIQAIAQSMDPDDVDFLKATSFHRTVKELQLDKKIGYTYKALSAAVWALYNATSYEHGVLTIINEGGDADTNGCVAGALLGAKFGFESIPEHLVEGLVHKDVLQNNVDRFIAEMEKKNLRSGRPTGFRHNSKLADNEPDWESVDKTSLPRLAFAEHGEAGKKSTWRYPHHWVQGGSNKGKNGIYKDGKMYIHQEGLNAAWAAAQVVESEQEVSRKIKSHLQAHRKALGLDKESTGTKESQTSSKGSVFLLFDGDVTADEILSAIKEHTSK